VTESVKRIGSRLVVLVIGLSTNVQVGVAGDVAVLKLTRSVSSTALVIMFPVFQFAPMDGSPELSPIPVGE
jgi:hypothetical protein